MCKRKIKENKSNCVVNKNWKIKLKQKQKYFISNFKQIYQQQQQKKKKEKEKKNY